MQYCIFDDNQRYANQANLLDLIFGGSVVPRMARLGAMFAPRRRGYCEINGSSSQFVLSATPRRNRHESEWELERHHHFSVAMDARGLLYLFVDSSAYCKDSITRRTAPTCSFRRSLLPSPGSLGYVLASLLLGPFLPQGFLSSESGWRYISQISRVAKYVKSWYHRPTSGRVRSVGRRVA